MASTGSEYFKAVFLKRRAWLMTLPPLLVALTQAVVNQLEPLQSDLRKSVPWKPSWEVWVLSIMIGFALAQFFAWLEHFKKNRDLISTLPRLVLADSPIEVAPF